MNTLKIVLLLSFIGLSFAQGGLFSPYTPEEQAEIDAENKKRDDDERKERERQEELREQELSLNETDHCFCRLRASARIVNGVVAEQNSIPWQVSLSSLNNDHFCGGSIVNKEYILTAAHCTEGKTSREIKVRVGLHHLDDPEIEGKSYLVEKIIQYPYDNPSLPGDISLLKLKGHLDFVHGEIEPACLNLERTEYHNELMASGWGTTTRSVRKNGASDLEEGEVSSVLKKAYFFQEKCPESFMDRDEFNICIRNSHGDSTCQGDSGGPLHHTQNGRTSVEGVLSAGKGETQENGDMVTCVGNSIYSRLSYYKDWIRENIKSSYCV